MGVTGNSLGAKSARTDGGEGTGAGTNGMGAKGGSPGACNIADTSDAGVSGGRGNSGESKGDWSGGLGEVSDDISIRDWETGSVRSVTVRVTAAMRTMVYQRREGTAGV